MPQTAVKTLFLRKHCDRRIRAGHLWVFSNEVDAQRSPLPDFAPGEEALLADASGHTLGSVYVNPATLIAARLFSRKAEALSPDLLRARLKSALDLRDRLFPRPFYRLCHSEGDGLPGLVLDRHGDCLVMQIGAAGMERHKAELAEILQGLLRPAVILARNRLAGRELEGLEQADEELWGAAPDLIAVEENGLLYQAPLIQGQKTGWFYDQRCNREALAACAQGADMLDVCCYAGGFGALAAARGARSVTFVDASARALELALSNAAKASPAAGLEALQGEVMEILAELKRQGKRFQTICLDPPAFIKRRKDADKGLEAYRRINELALDLAAPGAFLLTCSCSHHLEEQVLAGLSTRAAQRRGRFARLLYRGFQGPDHPVHPAMPESAYLKALLFHLE